jgi:hypothetical protein
MYHLFISEFVLCPWGKVQHMVYAPTNVHPVSTWRLTFNAIGNNKTSIQNQRRETTIAAIHDTVGLVYASIEDLALSILA